MTIIWYINILKIYFVQLFSVNEVGCEYLYLWNDSMPAVCLRAWSHTPTCKTQPWDKSAGTEKHAAQLAAVCNFQQKLWQLDLFASVSRKQRNLIWGMSLFGRWAAEWQVSDKGIYARQD